MIKEGKWGMEDGGGAGVDLEKTGMFEVDVNGQEEAEQQMGGDRHGRGGGKMNRQTCWSTERDRLREGARDNK